MARRARCRTLLHDPVRCRPLRCGPAPGIPGPASQRRPPGVGTCVGKDVATAAPVRPATLDILWGEGAGRWFRTEARIRWTDDGALGEAEMPVAERSRLEQRLARGACLGDEGALEALCRHQWFGVYKLVSGSVRDPIEAEEVTQEVFARAIARLSHFPYVSSSFRSYLSQIARRMLRDRWRDEHQDPGGASRPARPVRRALGVAVPETIVLAASQRRRLVAAIDRLPDRFREVLRLQLLEGRTAAEIAAEWGRTPEAVRRVRDGALEALRSEIERQGAR